MVKNRRSVATIDSPEFVKITSISPLISKCEIKVLYVGANRNRSFITKEVATEMAQTLPGCPIVGYYIENKEDFGDHGDQVIIDGEGVKFNTLTKPYGFVAPDSKIWFQKFEDTDEFGNSEIREYLMTEGYLWTGQFEEAKRVITKGNNQSMELDSDSLKGYWSTDANKGIDFFIINDAMFSKLCILGEDVEPCFEGANVTAPQLSSNFSKEDFSKSLFTMMQELKFALNNNEGGHLMENENLETQIVEENVETVVENFSNEEGKNSEIVSTEIENNVEEFAKKDEKDEEKDSKESETESEDSEDSKDSDQKDTEDKEEDEDKKKVEKNTLNETSTLEADFAKLQNDFAELQQSYSLLEQENKELLAFKKTIDDNAKNALIESFFMLSDEDKKDVVENKDKYTLDEIESKLSVICVRKKVNFNVDANNNTTASNNEEPLVYNLNSHENVILPEWLKVVENVKNRNK